MFSAHCSFTLWMWNESLLENNLHSFFCMIYREIWGWMHSHCEERDCADALLVPCHMIWSHHITLDVAKWGGEKASPEPSFLCPLLFKKPVTRLNMVQFNYFFFYFLCLHEKKSLEKSIPNTVTILKSYSDKNPKDSSQDVNRYCISAKCLGDKFWTCL